MSVMRRVDFIAGAGATLAFVCVRPLRALADNAARPIRVRLFAGIDLSSASIAGVRVDASSPPMRFSPPAQQQPLLVTATASDGTAIARTYEGSILSALVDGRLAVFNDVDLEAYVASVLASEVSSGWHPEMLKAQAVAVRTYGVRRMAHKHPATFDVVDDTTNQVYRGIERITPGLRAAAVATAGQILRFGAEPADVWYHSACGGHTAASTEVTGVAGPPYLQGIPDVDPAGHAYCSASPYFAWRNALTASSMARIVGVDEVTKVAVDARWPDGRVRSVTAQAGSGAPTTIDGQHFYARAAAVLGYKVVPSALFDIAGGPDSYEFTGHGVGHGVGMCQWGAQGRAKAGQSAADILAAYFPGTK